MLQQQHQQQQAFPPYYFPHQPLYESLGRLMGESPIDETGIDPNVHQYRLNKTPSQQQSLHNAVLARPAHQLGDMYASPDIYMYLRRDSD